MTDHVVSKTIPAGFNPANSALNLKADTALNASAKFWFLVMIAGQWVFVYYIAAFYGSLIFAQGLEGLQESHMPNGYVSGDTLGNVAVAAHVFMAFVIMGAGPLQLVPQIRNRFPVFHHWNGRLFLMTALLASVTGLYMTWARGTIGGTATAISISINAVLIIWFAAMTVKRAIERDISAHRRWALRLILAASGVWFFRIGLMLWLFIHQAPVGFDPETFRGPFLVFLGFAQYLVPLAALETYLWAKDKANSPGKLGMAIGLSVLTVGMGIGIFSATMGMWLPRI